MNVLDRSLEFYFFRDISPIDKKVLQHLLSGIEKKQRILFLFNYNKYFSYEEFHPFLFKQFESKPFIELPTFDRVD